MGTTYINPGLTVDRNTADEGTTALAFRRVLGTLVKQSAPGVPIAGRFGVDNFALTGKTNMSWDVTGGGAVLTRTGQGAYLVASHQTINVTTNAADGVNPRIDRIYLHQLDPTIDSASSDVRAYVSVAVGTPAATPTLPSIPTGALELGRAFIPAGATRTDNIALTDIAPVTGLSVGGILAVAGGGTGGSTKATARANLGITSGTGVPSNAMGDDGDIYFQIL